MRLTYLLTLALLVPACDSGESGDDDDDDDLVGADAALTVDADLDSPDADPTAPDAAPADCLFDDSVDYHLLAEVVQLESASGGTCVRLTRRNDCPPGWVCMAVPFTLQTFRAVHDGNGVYVDDESRLHWEATHHNWNDWGEATTETVRYRLESRYTDGFTDKYELSAYDTSSDALLWGPVELLPYVP